MRYLLKNNIIDWSIIKVIGFDIDGTLYDEFDFILEIYKKISIFFAENSSNEKEILDYMLQRWLEKGSSYPHIFDETADIYCKHEDKKLLVEKALMCYRNASPKIKIQNRIETILEFLKNKYNLFILSDGQYKLQNKKIKSLGLLRYFKKEDIVISGPYHQKPSKELYDKIKILRHYKPNEVVYIGDREIDREFASNVNINFLHIKYLHYYL